MLINSQLVKDHFGQYYKIQTRKDKAAPDALEAEIFRSNSQAQRFINDLLAPQHFWSKIYYSEALIVKAALSEASLRNEIAELLQKGKIKAFKIDIPTLSEHPPEKRSVKDSNRNVHTFAPTTSLLISNPKEVKNFTTKAEAEKYLKEISPNRIELQNIVKELELPVSSADDEFSELIDLITTGLADGTIVVLVDRYSAPPSSSDLLDEVQGDKDASKGPEVPPCTFDVMTIHCSHYPGDRSYILDVVKDSPNLNGHEKALQVIAKAGDPDLITIDYSGSCANNSEDCPSIKISSDALSGTFTDSPYEFEALPLDNSKEINTFSDFLKYCLVPDISGLDYQIYTVEKSGCKGNDGQIAKIHAFPTFKWEASVNFGYIQKDGTNEKNDTNASERGDWLLDAKITGNIGTKTYEFSSKDKTKTDEYFPGLKNKITKFIEDIDEMGVKTNNLGQNISSSIGLESDSEDGLLKFNVTWPTITLAGNLELKEATEDFDVDIGGEISLSMNPLVKADIRTDILDWIILSSGPQGKFLLKIKNKIKKRADVAVDIILEGKAEALLKWTKTAHETWLSTKGEKSGEATLGLFLGLEARAKATIDMIYVKVTLGLEVHAKGNTGKGSAEGIGVIFGLYATTNKDYPSLGGRTTFTGIAIYFSYYAEVSRSEHSSNDLSEEDTERNTNEDDDDDNDESSLKEQEMRKIQNVMAPWEFPEKPEKGSGTNLQDVDF